MKREYTVSDLFFTRWEDLTAKQIIILIELTAALQKLESGTTEHGLVIIQILRTLRKNKALVSKLEVDQAVDIFNDIKFFQRKADGSFETPWLFFPVEGFTTNNFFFARPELNGSLPMFNRSFQQLVYADSAFSGFCVLNHALSSGEGGVRLQLERDMQEAIASLVAVLYTPKELFDVADMEVRARQVPLKLNRQKQELVLHTYANVRSFITSRCPNLFPSPLEEAQGEVEPPTFTGPMWMDLRYDLAKTEVFKGFKTANDAGIYDALDFLETEIIKNKKQPVHG
jgi:hypothetical protein